MLKLYYSSQNNKKLEISKENFKRITYPVEQLKKMHKIISSDECKQSINKIKSFLLLVYSKEYINKIFNLTFKETLCDNCTYSNDIKKIRCDVCNSHLVKNHNKNYFDNDPDTLFTSFTSNDLLNTMNILIDILSCNMQYVYALIRPPGHHSSHDHHGGFCIVNNAYLLAKHFTQKGKRVLIFDWDLHHGDGTENLIVNNKDTIHYVSMHGYEPNFYPGTGSGSTNCENILNICLKRNTDDDEYMNMFNNIFVPYYKKIENNIDMIIVSNGLDGHMDDGYNFLKLTDEPYLLMTEFFKASKKQLVYLLEGGYNEVVISRVSNKIINLLY